MLRIKGSWWLLLARGVSTVLPAQYTSSYWDDRDKWMKTDSLLDLVKVGPGQIVADIGCHEGYLSMHLAQNVKEQGRVYAIDIRDDRLAKLRENASKRKLKNIITILGDPDDPKLPDGALDCVFLIDTYHEISAYRKVLNHIRKALKPGGRLLILEKLKDCIKGKSREVQVSAHSLAMFYVENELRQAGFKIMTKIDNHGFWKNEPDKIMWVVLAQKFVQ
ncbi:MAG: class I SAM-dependent methyltransferase [Bacteroidota bacterium]